MRAIGNARSTPPDMADVEDYFRREVPPRGQTPDLSHWPEDVRVAVREVAEVFNLRPPMRGRRSGGPFALWIVAARELEDACRPHGVRKVLEAVQRDVTLALHRGRGITIAGPQSLLNLARAKAADLSRPSALVPWDDGGDDGGDDGFVECPKCGHMVNPLTLGDRCEGSHYSRGSGASLPETGVPNGRLD